MTERQTSRGAVLVVDDNPTNLQLLIEYLDEMGFETLLARSGEGALEQARHARPDIILLDIMMPGMDGFEVCEQLKADPETRTIPVIFMTALTETEDKIRGFDLGAVDYITKPFHQKEVLARISTQLTIQRQNRELAELNAMKDKFVAIVATDLKNVFDTIIGPSRLLADSLTIFSEKEIRSIAKRLHRAAQDTMGMLEKIIDWVNIQRGEMTFSPGVVDLRERVTAAMESFREMAERKEIALRETIPPDLAVFADQERTGTVLENLIKNAVQFTRPGGEVVISAKPVDDAVEVSVADTGVGMSERNRKKLFRIDETYKKVGITGKEGTHLGLIICKEIVEASGGTVSVESELGKGTTVRFTLPRPGKETS
jgi:two-component system, sensor histidine kinase and response regulator